MAAKPKAPAPPAIPATNCSPGSVSWSGTETGHGEDNNNALGAYTEALKEAEKRADVQMDKFEAQKCPDGCSFQSNVRNDAIIKIATPIQRKPVKGKGMPWVCDLTLDWSETIYCYKTGADKEKADGVREKEKREREKKAKDKGE